MKFKKINYFFTAANEINRFIKLACIKKHTVVLCILSIFVAVLSIVTAVLFGEMIDQLLMSKTHIIINTLIIYIGLRLFYIIIEALLKLLSSYTRNILIYELRNETLRNLIKIDYEKFQVMKHGDLIGKIQESTFDLGDNLGAFLPEVIRRVLITIIMSIFITISSPLVGSLLIVLIIIMFYLQIFAGSHCDVFMEGMVSARNERNGLIHGIISNSLTIQIFDKNKIVPRWLENSQDKYIKKFTNAMTRLVLLFSPAKIVNELILVFICFGIKYINDYNTINIASFISLTTLITIAVNEMKGLDSILSNLPLILANIRDLNGIYNLGNDIRNEKKISKEKDIGNHTNLIDINKLDFYYSNGKNILFDFTLKITRGEKIAIIGDNGCGKSTLLNIISGLYRNYSGTINFFGEELINLPKNIVSEHIGYASQGCLLFDDSIFSNIKMSNNNLNEKMIEKALYNLDLGYIIENELLHVDKYASKLSAGERQRVVLARLILREAPILLLDEAISALDDNTARKIIKLLLDNKNQTVIFTIHKLDYTKYFDRILVMNEGQIIEDGNFAELMNKKSYFYERYESECESNVFK